MAPSADLITDRVLGTLLGVTAVALLVTAAPGQGPLLAGMIVAAALRWPAFRMHVALGTATITVFVLLLGQLLAASPPRQTVYFKTGCWRPWWDAALRWLESVFIGFSSVD
jgi:uncharacterized membrane protein YccC